MAQPTEIEKDRYTLIEHSNTLIKHSVSLTVPHQIISPGYATAAHLLMHTSYLAIKSKQTRITKNFKI